MPDPPPPLPSNQTLTPLQVGIGFPGGAEFIAHVLAICCELHPGGLVCGNDVRNGFNCCSRDAMFEGLRASPFAHLIPACGLWYAQHGALVLHRGSGTITDRDGRPIHSAEGARQGCGFGAFLFCVAYHRALTLTQRAFPDVLILSYVDDCYTFHPTNPLRAHEAMQCLRGHLLSRCKLESVPSKAFVSPTTDLSFVPKEMKGHPDTARLLTFKAVGAYICGTDPTHILAASHAITCDVISKAKNHRLFALLRP